MTSSFVKQSQQADQAEQGTTTTQPDDAAQESTQADPLALRTQANAGEVIQETVHPMGLPPNQIKPLAPHVAAAAGIQTGQLSAQEIAAAKANTATGQTIQPGLTSPPTSTGAVATGTTAPAKHESFLQKVGDEIHKGEVDIKNFVEDVPKVISAWNKLAPQVKSVAAQLSHDVLSIVSDGGADVAAVQSLNVAQAVTLSAATWAAIQQLVTDAKAGDQEIVASLHVLGVQLF